MYCSQCGAKGDGNFCSQCGARLDAGSSHAIERRDWSHEIRYDVLLRDPEVRDLIARHAAQAGKRMSGEDFLALCDELVLTELTGVSIGKVASIVQPIYARLGIGTGKTRAEVLRSPPGKTLVAILCSLARHGRTLRNVQQAQDGCVLEAAIPSDMWSFEGDLLITVRRQDEGTFVEAATKIKGQLFDWGKSKRCLNDLFADLDENHLSSLSRAG